MGAITAGCSALEQLCMILRTRMKWGDAGGSRRREAYFRSLGGGVGLHEGKKITGVPVTCQIISGLNPEAE